MNLNVAVIFGGRSVEHEISIISALQCIHAIDKSKYNVLPIYITKQGVWYTGDALFTIENFRKPDQLLAKCEQILVSQNANEHVLTKAKAGILGNKILAKIDIAFPMVHGTFGEDGTLQGLLELMNIPYVGCDVLSSAIAMDKIVTKQVLQSIDIPQLDYVWFYASEWINTKAAVLEKIYAKFKFPLIVKPANLGSSVGVTSVDSEQELEEAIDLAASMAERILVEPKVENLREINCAVLGDYESCAVSVCEEPLRQDQILSYQDKYVTGSKKSGGMSSAKRQIPANISANLSEKICGYAKKAFQHLNCSGVARIDFLLDKNSTTVYLCEINTIPGSLSFYLWEPKGVGFTELTTRLIELALKKQRAKNNLILSYDTNILQGFSLQGKS